MKVKLVHVIEVWLWGCVYKLRLVGPAGKEDYRVDFGARDVHSLGLAATSMLRDTSKVFVSVLAGSEPSQLLACMLALLRRRDKLYLSVSRRLMCNGSARQSTPKLIDTGVPWA